MRDAHNDIESRGARLVVVGNGQPWHAKAFREDEGLGFDLWVDPDMKAYQAAGLKRKITDTISLKSLGHGWRALRSGFRQRGVQGDPWQLGGAFVISPNGKTHYEHVSREAGDHAPIDKILTVLDRLAAN